MHPTLNTRARTKQKTCANCLERYTPGPNAQPFEKWCSLDCAVAISRKAQERARAKRKQREARALRQRKEEVKSRSKWLQEAQAALNGYIRARDAGPCISCQRHHAGQYHAGHYRTTGAMPSLRFNTYNCHKQCAPCNNHLSGNLVEYRANLIEKIGQARVDWLEGPQDTKNLDIEYLKRVKRIFRKRERLVRGLRGLS